MKRDHGRDLISFADSALDCHSALIRISGKIDRIRFRKQRHGFCNGSSRLQIRELRVITVNDLNIVTVVSTDQRLNLFSHFENLFRLPPRIFWLINTFMVKLLSGIKIPPLRTVGLF